MAAPLRCGASSIQHAYGRVFEQANGLKYDKYKDMMERYPELGGLAVPLKKLRRVNAPILGVVLNQLDLERAEKYYGEYSGYRSYKGYKKYGYSKTYGSAN